MIGVVNNRARQSIRTCPHYAMERLETRALLSTTASSLPTDVIAFNGRTYFVADDGIHGNQLWVTDGTEAGTSAIQLGITSHIAGVQAVDSKLFVFDYDKNIASIWATDGTAGGTRQVSNLSNGVFTLDGDIYFIRKFNPYPSTSPFFVTGTDTEVIDKLHPPNGAPKSTISLAHPNGVILGQANGSIIYETETEGNNGHFYSIYATGGLASNALHFANPSSLNSVIDAVQAGGDLYLTNGGLWKISKIKDGPQKLYDSEYVDELSNGDGAMLFSTYPYLNNMLWISDGTPAGTRMIAKLPGEASEFQNFGQRAFFTLAGPDGIELWTSDQSSAGTYRLTKVPLVIRNTHAIDNVVELNGTFYFLCNNKDLWRTDGTSQGTELVISPDVTFAEDLRVANGRLYFTANDKFHNFELWTSLGTAESTALVSDINTSPHPGV